MDTTAPDIVFDEEGVCNYCSDFLESRERYVEADPVRREEKLQALVARVKERGRGKRYDCIVGVSGGVDSSWALVQAVRLGLRPLAVHMDSGWNSELAQNNIANLVRTLGVDLYTHVIDWPEIRGLMEAFFAAAQPVNAATTWPTLTPEDCIAAIEEYRRFLRDLFTRLNRGRRARFQEEQRLLRRLPERRLEKPPRPTSQMPASAPPSTTGCAAARRPASSAAPPSPAGRSFCAAWRAWAG